MQPEDDLEKLMRELVFEQVANTIKEDRKNWASRLEELGFQWLDDEDGQEGFAKASAKPENPDQELLVAFFEVQQNLQNRY